MKRYRTDVRGGTLHLERDDGWMRVGAMDDICELVGGEEYSIEYDERERAAAWLNDDEGTVTFDVRDTLADLTFDDEFVGLVAQVGMDEVDEEGYPLRTSVFADMLTRIWDSKGDIDSLSE